MPQMVRELVYALRSLIRNPGFTVVALSVLAIGIGANTAVFSAVYGVLLKPLNYRDPSRLFVVLSTGEHPVSPADYLDFRAQTTAFQQLEAAQAWSAVIDAGDRPQITLGLQVSAGMLRMLGVKPERGRVFHEGDDRTGSTPVLVISHRLWQQQFGADPELVGRTVRLNARPFTIIGVMPPGFQFAPFWQTEAQMWTPLDLSSHINDRSGRSLRLFGRLKQNTGVEQGRAQLASIAQRLEQRFPASNKGVGVEVIPLLDEVVGPVRPTLFFLSATVLFVLLIACANLANLLLTRGIARRGEIALRLAIGASRWRLIRQLLTESILVSIAGGAAGILLARWCLRISPAVLPAGLVPRLGEINLHVLALVFAVGISIATGIASGLFAALQSSKIDLAENLRQAGHGVIRTATARGRNFLIAAEVSTALLLLVCAGLMIRTLNALNRMNAGFDPHNVLSMYVFAPAEMKNSDLRISLFDRVSRSLAAIPGVEQVSAINHLPIGGDVWTFSYTVPGRPAPPPGEEPGAIYRVVRPSYFSTMRIPMLRGRDFTSADNAQAAPVVVINEKLARDEWPGRNPVGQTLSFGAIPANPDKSGTKRPPFTIIGVVANAKQSDWTGAPVAEFYLPYLQHADAWDQNHLAFVLRTRVDPSTIRYQAERAIRDVDPGIPVSDVAPMEEIIAGKLWRSRISALLLSGFAVIALVLAVVGIYGVVSYSVRQRAMEIGIRLALGAQPAHILGVALRESVAGIISGLLIGLTASLATTRLLRALLYNVKPTDLLTFVLVVAVLAGAAAAASLIPAWKAIRVSRLSMLRHE